jgi:hypothetical protein
VDINYLVLKACLDSLFFREMNLRRNDIKVQAPETCAWLLEHANYKSWLRQRQGLLWIKGNPGAGKSTLLKYALNECEGRASPNELVVASFFFHGRGDPIQKSSLGLFRSLVHQILRQIPDLLTEFTSIYKNKREPEGSKIEWHEAELQRFFGDLHPSCAKVVLDTNLH